MTNEVSKTAAPVVSPFPWLTTEFDQYFNRLMRGAWPFRWPEVASQGPRSLRAFEHMPEIEVKENGKLYTVSVELPGLDEKDVKATVKDDVLTISGEKNAERTDDKTHYSERTYGAFSRSFALPADADGNEISARFAKGVLTLEIAKAANPSKQAKQIEIKQA